MIRLLLAELLARLFGWAMSSRARCFEIPVRPLRRFDA